MRCTQQFSLPLQRDFADLVDLIQSTLAHIADGICHALKVRVETILNTGSDLISLYAISNLMRFYENIINQVCSGFEEYFSGIYLHHKFHSKIVRGGQLEACIANLQKYSEETYLNVLTVQVKSLLHGPAGSHMGLEPPQTTLVPPQNVARLLSVLKEILSVASMVESRQTDIIKASHYNI